MFGTVLPASRVLENSHTLTLAGHMKNIPDTKIISDLILCRSKIFVRYHLHDRQMLIHAYLVPRSSATCGVFQIVQEVPTRNNFPGGLTCFYRYLSSEHDPSC